MTAPEKACEFIIDTVSIIGLGLRKIGSEVELPKTKETLGLINKVIHLVEIKG